MEENENIYDKIKELLGSLPNQLKVLEEKIDLELQLEYYEHSRRYSKNFQTEEVGNYINDLFSTASEEEQKTILAGIGSLPVVDAYRAIERFILENNGILKNWAILALQENRMLLESMLLDESHVFISTGLGGKGHKLRYFIVLFGRDNKDFSDLQKKIIKTEFEICLKKYNSEIEQFNFSGSLANLSAIIPMTMIIKQIFAEAIEECNNYGDFLLTNFIITNVKELSFDEVRDYVKNKNFRKGDY